MDYCLVIGKANATVWRHVLCCMYCFYYDDFVTIHPLCELPHHRGGRLESSPRSQPHHMPMPAQYMPNDRWAHAVTNHRVETCWEHLGTSLI